MSRLIDAVELLTRSVVATSYQYMLSIPKEAITHEKRRACKLDARTNASITICGMPNSRAAIGNIVNHSHNEKSLGSPRYKLVTT